MKKSVIVVLLITLLLVVSCQPRVPSGEEPRDTSAILKQVQSGTEGVTVKTLQNYPPRIIYDQNELVAILEVKNRGNFDLDPQDCFVQITGFDRNIITGDFDEPRSCSDSLSELEGKNVYNLEGGFNQLEFYSSNVDLPDNVFEYNPTLNFVTCYKYQTKASPSACIDPMLYQISSEQKACDYRKGISTGGSQGAPVSVSTVRSDMVTSKSKSKAVFEIDITNSNKGRVLSSETDIRNCGENRFSYTDMDKVAYNVELSGGSLINCNPGDGFVRLSNNRGKIVCTFEVAEASAFETPLIITLDYNYMDSYRQPVKIIKTPE